MPAFVTWVSTLTRCNRNDDEEPKGSSSFVYGRSWRAGIPERRGHEGWSNKELQEQQQATRGLESVVFAQRLPANSCGMSGVKVVAKRWVCE